MQMNTATPPEVNIEVPSDSDSSRRPSAYSGNYQPYEHRRRRSSTSSFNDFGQLERERDGGDGGGGDGSDEEEDVNGGANDNGCGAQDDEGNIHPRNGSNFIQGNHHQGGGIVKTANDLGEYFISLFNLQSLMSMNHAFFYALCHN